MSTNPNLPSGWTESTFGAVVSAISVNDKKLPRGQYLEAGRFPVVDQGQQFIGGYSNDESRVISEDLPVLVFGDHTRAFKYLNQPFVPGADGVKVLKPHGVDAKWLFEIAHALEFPDKGYARHYQHLNSAKLLVPPLPEQRRIVAEIEKQFTRLEAGVAALRRVQANLKRYRAAVLKAACEGRLVPTEAELQSGSGVPPLGSGKKRQDAASTFETGEALLARILTERRQNWQGRGQYKEPDAPDKTKLGPLPEGWTWANVAQLSFLDVGFAFKSAEFVQFGVRLLRGENLEPGKMRWSDTRYWPESKLDEFRQLLIREGEIVLAMDRPLISSGLKIARARADDLPCLLVQRMARFRPVVERMTSFLFTAMNTHGFIRHLLGGQTGTQLPHISGEGIQSFPVALPPLAEQKRIVAEVERRLSVVEELESVVTANLQRATRLRQSILQKAFTGALPTQ